MPDDKVNELMEQLEKGIKETMDSEKFKSFLRVQSQFHNYSFNNAMLIYLQRPDASNVAGFQTWKNKFERNVLRGEKGIGILAPCPYKYEKTVEVKSSTSGETENKTSIVEGLRFRKVTVFDVNQTDGKSLPEICNELQGNSVNAANIIKAVRGVSEIPIIEKAIESGAKGYYSRLENIIVIKEGMTLDQSAKTHVHEYCHSKIHNTEACKLFDRATKEVQAESVAYVVCNRLGLDTSQYSFEYLANWSSNKELKELRQSFDIIQKTSNDIIGKMEKITSNNMELQQSPAKNQQQPLQQSIATNVLEKIKELYKSEYAAIAHITDNTARIIDNINQHKSTVMSIREIKDTYKETGKRLELNNDKSDVEDFSLLKDVVEDLKHAQLTMKQQQSHGKAIQNQLSKVKDMEMV